MSTEALKEYILRSKYARFNRREKRRESYTEATNRVRQMMLGLYPQIADDINRAYDAVLQQKVLGSQRALQFGGKPALQHNARVYNCCSSYCDRLRFFQEAFYLLLCGCGTGFSVQKHHIAKLPKFVATRLHPKHAGHTFRIDEPVVESIWHHGTPNVWRKDRAPIVFVVPDTIEGWADAVGVLLSSYFEGPVFPKYYGRNVVFDYSLIRPEGSHLSSGAGKAPGPEPLMRAIEKIRELLDRCITEGRDRLRPIDAYDIVMHASDAVLAGGVRRSACICIFSADDEEMITAKTGNWFETDPQRGRSNNSALLIRGKTTRRQFRELMKHVREWGEPGFYWSDNTEQIPNPCVEIGFWCRLMMEATAQKTRELLTTYQGPVDYAMADPAFEGREVGNNTILVSGWQFCNLSTINGALCETPEDFYEACEHAATIGTCQAAMTEFPYLGPVTELIVRKEALLGVSITAVMDSPKVLLDPEVLRKGAAIVLRKNEGLSARLVINPAARATTMKPEGTGTLMLGSLACGLRPWHARRVLRQVQANRNEPVAQFFKRHNPWAVEKSVWCQNGTTEVLTFCVEAPAEAVLAEDVNAIDFLKNVETVVENWIRPGKRPERCTQPWLTHNVSNTVVVKPEEWEDVTDYIYDHRENFAGVSLLPWSGDRDYPQAPFVAVYSYEEICERHGGPERVATAHEYLRRALPVWNGDVFAMCNALAKDNPPSPDLTATIYLLKDLYYLDRWNRLKAQYRPVDYDQLIETEDTTVPQAEAACAGGTCTL